MRHFNFKELNSPYFSNRLKASDLSNLSITDLLRNPDLTLQLAETLYPSKKWKVVKSQAHWVVVDYKQTLVFDPIGFESFNPKDSLNLAMFGNLITTELLRRRGKLAST